MKLNNEPMTRVLAWTVPREELRRFLVTIAPAVFGMLIVVIIQAFSYLNALNDYTRADARRAATARDHQENPIMLAAIERDNSALTEIRAQRQAALAPLIALHTLSSLLPTDAVRITTVTITPGATFLTLDGEAQHPADIEKARNIIGANFHLLSVTTQNAGASGLFTWKGNYQP